MEPTVRDAPEANRFEIRDGERVLGLAAYERRGRIDRHSEYADLVVPTDT
jgi:hypothetical protein